VTSVGHREALAQRQREVLDDLLAGRVPAGFDPGGAAMTTRVLHRKRSSAVEKVAPEILELPGWPARFHAWAATSTPGSCGHDDLERFVATLDAEERRNWTALHDVMAGRRWLAWVRLGDPEGRVLLVGVGPRVWRFARRRRTSA
jgi:hypothetical protein